MANYFSLILVIVTALSGLIWLLDGLVFAPKRRARVASINAAVAKGDSLEVAEYKEPYVVDTAKTNIPSYCFCISPSLIYL